MIKRKLTDDEKHLIERILSNDHALAIDGIEISEDVSEDLNGEMIHLDRPDGEADKTRFKYPIEAMVADVDGTYIHALLFCIGKSVDLLELYKDDSSPIIGMPLPAEWEICDLSTKFERAQGFFPS